jgi:hypothetical protein
MALYGGQRDVALFRNMNRELLRNIITQEIAYYKIGLTETIVNIYGESSKKSYNDPVLLTCLITRGDQSYNDDDFGPDVKRDVSFAFLRDDLVDLGLVPEDGDIVSWQESYYEIHQIVENQLVLGKSEQYNMTNLSNFGSSLSIICNAHLTRAEKVGINIQRL